MKVKKWFLLFLITVLAFVFISCSNQEVSNVKEGAKDNVETKVIKIAHYSEDVSPLNKALTEVFKTMVEEKSKGSLKIEIYPNAQLGSETEYLSVLKSGSIQMAFNGALVREVPQASVIGLPFLFKDYDEAKKVLTSPVAWETVPEYTEKLGLHVLGFSPNGFRVFTSNEPLEKLEDFKGLKLRVSEGYEIPKRMGQALKANITPLPSSELFTSLETGIVDAQENPVQNIVSGAYFEVQKYAFLTRHIFSHDIIHMNNKFWESLTQEEQAIIEEATNAMIDKLWEGVKQREKDGIEVLKKEGIQVSEPSEELKKEFRDTVQPVYDWYYEENPWAKELIEKIEAAK